MKSGLYYFAHCYTVKDDEGRFVPEGENANFDLCNYRSGRLLLAGYNIYSPTSHTHPIHRATPEFMQKHEHKMWYDLDISFLENANFTGIILAPGWENSTGCLIEKNWFEANGGEVLYYNDIVKGE